MEVTEPGADRGPQAGSPLGVVDATGPYTQPPLRFHKSTTELKRWLRLASGRYRSRFRIKLSGCDHRLTCPRTACRREGAVAMAFCVVDLFYASVPRRSAIRLSISSRSILRSL